MSKGLLFWILMVLWLLFGVGVIFGPQQYGFFVRGGFTLLEFVLFGLLGWSQYGPPIR